MQQRPGKFSDQTVHLHGLLCHYQNRYCAELDQVNGALNIVHWSFDSNRKFRKLMLPKTDKFAAIRGLLKKDILIKKMNV